MAELPIRIMGDPVLHAPAARVDEITDEVRNYWKEQYREYEEARAAAAKEE